MFYGAYFAGGMLASDDNLDKLIERVTRDPVTRDLIIWQNNVLWAVILAPGHTEGIPVVLQRRELGMAGLILSNDERWTIAGLHNGG